MRLSVESVIYLYLFVCVALLVFNILYIGRSKWVERQRERRIRRWEARLEASDITEKDASGLRRISQMTAFSVALERKGLVNGKWFLSHLNLVQTLALSYQNRPAMERAFIGYWIASFHTPVGKEQAMLPQIMLSYLDHSTVFCRENTLHALYALGHAMAVEHALQVMSERQYYHNPKLLSDGMMTYTGDVVELVDRLWKHRMEWEECIMVSVVQYASMLKTAHWAEPFLAELQDERVSLEIMFSLVRYFQRHVYAPALPVLLHLAQTDEAGEADLKVAAVSALQNYEGDEVHRVLLGALKDRNWYVRRNAAQSLLKRGISQEDLASIRQTGDRYALEMLEYMAGMDGLTGKGASHA